MTRRRGLALTGLAATLAAAGALMFAPEADAQALLRGEGGAAYVVGVTSWVDMPFRTIVRQQYDYSCGSAALATLLHYHYGRATTEQDVFTAMYAVGDQEKIQRVGFSLLDMKRYLTSIGLQSDGYRLNLQGLARMDTPAIVLIQVGSYKHFVVLKGVRDGWVLLGDPALGLHQIPEAEFMSMWNGIAFAIHGREQPARFNIAAEWEAKTTAPLGAGYEVVSIDTLTRELAPLYQITPLIVSSVPQP